MSVHVITCRHRRTQTSHTSHTDATHPTHPPLAPHPAITLMPYFSTTPSFLFPSTCVADIPIGIRQTFMVRVLPSVDTIGTGWVSPWTYYHVTIPRIVNTPPVGNATFLNTTLQGILSKDSITAIDAYAGWNAVYPKSGATIGVCGMFGDGVTCAALFVDVMCRATPSTASS